MFILIFTGSSIQYLFSNDGVQVYAEESMQGPPSEGGFFSGVDSMSVTETVYSDAEILALDAAWLTADLIFRGNDYGRWEVGDDSIMYYGITNNIHLPDKGEHESTITWASSNESIIGLDGTVNRPKYLERDQEVILTATLASREEQIHKTFRVLISCMEPTPEEAAVEADDNWLQGETVIHNGVYYDEIRSNVHLPTVGEKGGSTICWVSSNPDLLATDGTVTQPPFSYAMGAAPVTLTATISQGDATLVKEFYLEVYPLLPEVEDHVAYDMDRLTYELILNGNSADDVKRSLYPRQNLIKTTGEISASGAARYHGIRQIRR